MTQIASSKVLFVSTSHDELGQTAEKTGVWLEEIAVPYYIFKDMGATITLASPNGGRVPLDPKSQSILLATFHSKRFLKDESAMDFLSASVPFEKIDADNFDTVFVAGGHGPMWDLAENKKLKALLEAFDNANKPIGAVCHGVVALLPLKNKKGELVINGRQLTCFSNTEEELSGLATVVPFLLETKLTSLGGVFTKGESYVSHVVEDGNIITGQNPASSRKVAQKMISLLQHNRFMETLLQPASN